MIHRIYSNLSSFKEINFRPGLNIILAEKSPGATERQTRNGAGKTSIIEVIHFLMGANADKSSIFKTKVLVDFSFGIEFDLKSSKIAVERSGQKPSEITLKGDITGSIISLSSLDLFQRGLVSNNHWKDLLGLYIFSLKNIDNDEENNKFNPSFRALFSYFARRQMGGGFNTPIRNSSMQQPWDWQVSITYLLGLDWSIPQKWQFVRERERNLKELKKAANEGAFGSVIGSIAELRTELTIAEDRARQLRDRISVFQVLPEYSDLEKEASQLSRQIGALADENTIDRGLLADLEQSIHNEASPATIDLERLYGEVGVVLPSVVVRRFDEVQTFHDSVIRNRRLYLGAEIQATRRRIEDREQQKARLGSRQSEIMRLLKSYGALDQYAQLQAELARAEALTETLRQRFAAAEQLEGSKTELDIERNRLLLLLQQDHREQHDILQHAILVFQEISNALYEQAGSLTIDGSNNGPVFDISIQGKKSKGISNMQIFCFDMMLVQLCSERGMGPGFLLHDSHIFDGVDERQIGRALYVGHQLSTKFGFQYIVTMNSDAIPSDLPSNFDINDHILPIRLTDKTEEGGLFGLRFG